MSNTPVKSRAIVSDRVVAHFAQLLAFFAAIAVLPLTLVATVKFASSPFDVFSGVVLGGILASALIIIGLVTPSAISATHR